MILKNSFTKLVTWITLTLVVGAGFQPAVGFSADPARNTASITGRVRNVVTGKYLLNARVSVKGTDRVAFTDEFGTYRLVDLPGGVVELDVYYTGLDRAQVRADVSPGQTVEQDIDLTSVTRYGDAGQVAKLDPFVVASSKETDGEAIAVNEQRFAPNIKNVVAADALGDVMDGNVGEFLKFLPGITAEYDAEAGGTVAAISVRGIGSDMTSVSSDGMQMANTSNAVGESRSFQFSQVSMNNISRIEVSKVPTPAMPADSLAGSVNMVSKSAFERSKAELRYSVSLSANHEFLELGKSPNNSGKEVYKIRPSLSFDYTLPINRNFGLVLTGASANRFLQQYQIIQTYQTGGTATGASPANPFLQTYRYINQPRITKRNSIGLRADWRVTRNAILSVALQASEYGSDVSGTDFQASVGANANPTPATGARFTYGEDFVNGATGRGSVSMMAAASVNQELTTKGVNGRYLFDNGRWKVEARGSASNSQGGYRDQEDGHFRQLGITLAGTAPQVAFSGIDAVGPKLIQIFGSNGQPVDITKLANYRLNTAASSPRHIIDEMLMGGVDIRRRLDRFSFPLSLQTGGQWRQQIRDFRRYNPSYTYNGLDGNAATAESPEPYINTIFLNQPNSHHFGDMVWPSVYKAWEAWQSNPSLFSITPAQEVATERIRITSSKYIREQVSALYLQAEGRLLRDRLKVLAGVRHERTDALGRGPLNEPDNVYRRAADGSFARDAQGKRIRKPEAGAVGSWEELGLTQFERAAKASRSYDGFYPSVHFTYEARENLLVRAAYAQTYGRPDFMNIIPNAVIAEADLDDEEINSGVTPGVLTVTNIGLRPWSAKNYDLSFEYYSRQGGLLSAGVFLKDIRDFFGSGVRIATPSDLAELGLDPRYEGWELRTQFNSGDARVTGVELNFRQSLQPLGGWGRFFSVFANGTKLKLEGSQQASFASFVPESANWGVTYSRKPITLWLKWNYRGLQSLTPVTTAGTNGFNYAQARTTLDVNLDVHLTKRTFLYANAQNVFNESRTLLRYGTETPDYAKVAQTFDNGIQLTVGIKGTF